KAAARVHCARELECLGTPHLPHHDAIRTHRERKSFCSIAAGRAGVGHREFRDQGWRSSARPFAVRLIIVDHVMSASYRHRRGTPRELCSVGRESEMRRLTLVGVVITVAAFAFASPALSLAVPQ